MPKKSVRTAGARRPAVTRHKTASKRGLEIDRDKVVLHRLGLAIRVARVSRGMNQRELARRIRRSQNLVWRIEAGVADPGILLLQKIADALKMSFDFFLLAVCGARTSSDKDRQAFYNGSRDMMFSLLEGFGEVDTGHGRDQTKAGGRS